MRRRSALHLSKAAVLTSNFAFAFANSLNRRAVSARVFHRVCNQGRTNKRVFQALERSTFNDAAQQGVTNNTHVYAKPRPAYAVQSFLPSYATESATTADSAPLATSC